MIAKSIIRLNSKKKKKNKEANGSSEGHEVSRAALEVERKCSTKGFNPLMGVRIGEASHPGPERLSDKRFSRIMLDNPKAWVAQKKSMNIMYKMCSVTANFGNNDPTEVSVNEFITGRYRSITSVRTAADKAEWARIQEDLYNDLYLRCGRRHKRILEKCSRDRHFSGSGHTRYPCASACWDKLIEKFEKDLEGQRNILKERIRIGDVDDDGHRGMKGDISIEKFHDKLESLYDDLYEMTPETDRAAEAMFTDASKLSVFKTIISDSYAALVTHPSCKDMDVQEMVDYLQELEANNQYRETINSAKSTRGTKRKMIASLQAAESSDQSNKKFDGNCNHCGIYGHKWAECRKRLAGQPATKKKTKNYHNNKGKKKAPWCNNCKSDNHWTSKCNKKKGQFSSNDMKVLAGLAKSINQARKKRKKNARNDSNEQGGEASSTPNETRMSSSSSQDPNLEALAQFLSAGGVLGESLCNVDDEVIAAAGALGINNVAIYDTGAGKAASGNLDVFQPGSLKDCTDDSHLIDAGKKRHNVAKIGTMCIDVVSSTGKNFTIRLPNQWYVPTLGFTLVSGGALKQANYQATIGDVNKKDYLTHKPSGTKVPLVEFKGVFIIKTRTNARWGKHSHDGNFDADYAWSILMSEEEEDTHKSWSEYAGAAGIPVTSNPKEFTKNEGSGKQAINNRGRLFGKTKRHGGITLGRAINLAIVCMFTMMAATIPPLLHHHRMMHHNNVQLENDILTGAVGGVKINGSFRDFDPFHKCDSCILGKHKRATFKAKDNKAPDQIAKRLIYTSVGDLLHMDSISSPEPSLHGAVGAIIFKDEATRYSWVYPYKNKDDVYEVIELLDKEIRNVFHSKLRIIRTDGAGEYTGKRWQELEKSIDFMTQYSSAYTPEQNSEAERNNGVLQDMARTAMINSGLPDKFWALALLHAAYIRNRIGHKAVGGRTPFELAFHHPPNLKAIRVFGCAAWAIIPKDHRKKWDSRSIKGLYVGHSEDKIAYKIYDPKTDKIVESPHVIFDETQYGANYGQDWSGEEVQRAATKPSNMSMAPQYGVPPNRPSNSQPANYYIGKRIKRRRREWGSQFFFGTVARYDHPYFVIEYDDGDIEDMTEAEVKKFMLRTTQVEGRSQLQPMSNPHELHEGDAPETSVTQNTENAILKERMDRERRLQARNERKQDLMNSGLHTECFADSNTSSKHAHLNGLNIRSEKKRRTFAGIFAYVTAASIFYQTQQTETGRSTFGGAATVFDPLKVPEPNNLAEAMRRPDSDLWWEAWMQERGQMDLYGVYEIVPVPENVNIVDSKIVFKIKKNADGTIERYKCRLVARGFTQRYNCDYHETFAPVATSTTVRTMLSVCCQRGYFIRQLDITAAYLQGELTDHTIYMRPPKGDVAKMPDGTPAVWKLKKSVYGLKQAGIVWGRKLSKFLITELKYTRCDCDPCLFYKTSGSSVTYVCSYVDDCIYAGNSEKMLDELKNALHKKFGIRDMNEPNWFLGLNVKYDRVGGTLSLNQSSYVLEACKKFKLDTSPAYSTPFEANAKLDEPKEGEELTPTEQQLYMQLIGTLNYAATQTRPDISVNVSILSQFMARAGKVHLKAAIRTLLYLKGTHSQGLVYHRNSQAPNVLECYCDASYAPGGKTGSGWRRSRSGAIFMINGAAVSWLSKNQTCVALSTAEAEYIALSLATQEVVWLRRLLKFLGHVQIGPTAIFEDNQAAQIIATTDMDSKRSKHIDVRYHYTREKCLENIVKITWCGTGSMVADMLTKSLDKTKLEKFWSMARGETKTEPHATPNKRKVITENAAMIAHQVDNKLKWVFTHEQDGTNAKRSRSNAH